MCVILNDVSFSVLWNCSMVFVINICNNAYEFCILGVTFKAHKLILAACSKHFQDMFQTAPLCPSVLVILDGTSSSNMSALLEFMYKGEVHVSQDSLPSFLKAAECLQVGIRSVWMELVVTGGAHINDGTGRMSHWQNLQ
jgi:hypothetical protein